MATSLGVLVPLGLKVKMAEVSERFGWAVPGPDDAVLAAPVAAAPPVIDPLTSDVKIKGVSGEFKRGEAVPRTMPALQQEGPPAVVLEAPSDVDLLAAQLALEARPAMVDMLGQIEAMVGAAGSLDELREMLMTGFPDVDASALSDVLSQAMLGSDAGGRLRVLEESGD